VKKITLFVLTIVVTGLGAFAATDLEALKNIYDTEVKKVHEQYRSGRLTLPQEHIKSLRDLEQTFQRSGDLKSLLAVREERTRFMRDPKPESIKVASAPAQLGVLQKKFIVAFTELKKNRDFRLTDLSEKYTRRLEQLQRELTIRGNIEEALAVMKEVERMKGSGQPEPDEPPPARKPAPPPAAEVSLSDLRNVLGGNIVKWNSQNGEIVLEYSFEDENEGKDWKGGSVNTDDDVLDITGEPAWLGVPFDEIREIDVSFEFRDELKQARISLGRNNANLLAIEMQETDEESVCTIYQTSKYNPISRENVSLKTVIENRLVMTFDGSALNWQLNYGDRHNDTLQSSIRFPVYISVGIPQSRSCYNHLQVTGTLNAEYVKQLASR